MSNGASGRAGDGAVFPALISNSSIYGHPDNGGRSVFHINASERVTLREAVEEARGAYIYASPVYFSAREVTILVGPEREHHRRWHARRELRRLAFRSLRSWHPVDAARLLWESLVNV